MSNPRIDDGVKQMVRRLKANNRAIVLRKAESALAAGVITEDEHRRIINDESNQ